MKYAQLILALFLSSVLMACNSQLGEPWNGGAQESMSSVINGDTFTRDGGASKSVVVIELLDIRGRLQSFCTGTLISTKFVLTAAHCFDSNLIRDVSRANIVFDAAIEFHPQGKSKAIVSLRAGNPVKHPLYNTESQWDHDAAVISFRGKIPEGFAPAVLDDDKSANYEGQKLTVYGYGKSKDYTGVVGEDIYRFFGKLLRGEITVGDNYHQFRDRYASTAGAPQQLCQGDSGGPQFLVSKNGVTKQVGINSAVDGPKLPNGMRSCYGPAYATKVASVYEWIQKQIR